MTLQTTGAISFNDLHIEAGGTSGTQVSLNDADIIQLSRPHNPFPAGSERRMSQFYGQQELLSSPFVLLHQTSGEEDAWRQMDTLYSTGVEPDVSTAQPFKEDVFESMNSELIGRTGRLLFIYQNGIDGGASARGEIQIDKVVIEGVAGTGNAQTVTWETGNESWTTSVSILSTADPYPQDRPWYNVGTSTKTSYGGRFVRDAGGTPNSNTGRTDAADGSYYMFAYGTGEPYGSFMFLRSPEFTFGSGVPSTNSAYDGTGTGQIFIRYSVARLGDNIGLLRLFFVESGHASTTTRGAANEVTITASNVNYQSKNAQLFLDFDDSVQNFDSFFNKVYDPIDSDLLSTITTLKTSIDTDAITSGFNTLRIYDGLASSDTVDYTAARMRPFEYIQLKQDGTVIVEWRVGDLLNTNTSLTLVNRDIVDQERFDTSVASTATYTLTVGY